MYTANSPKELKKLIEEDKFPVLIADEKTLRLVEILESLKNKGVKETAKDEIKKALLELIPTNTNIISEAGFIIIFGFSLATIIALYALYKGKNIKLKFGPPPVIYTEN